MKRYNKAVAAFRAIYTILFALGTLFLAIYTPIARLSWLYFIVEIFCGLIILILVWALNNALKRVSILENILIKKEFLKEEEIEAEADNIIG